MKNPDNVRIEERNCIASSMIEEIRMWTDKSYICRLISCVCKCAHVNTKVYRITQLSFYKVLKFLPSI